MAEKCEECSGYGHTSSGNTCRACDGTGVELATCEGVPPGSGAVRLRISDRGHTHVEWASGHCNFGAHPCGYIGIRFPSHPGPDGRPIPDDPDAGRYWRRR